MRTWVSVLLYESQEYQDAHDLPDHLCVSLEVSFLFAFVPSSKSFSNLCSLCCPTFFQSYIHCESYCHSQIAGCSASMINQTIQTWYFSHWQQLSARVPVTSSARKFCFLRKSGFPESLGVHEIFYSLVDQNQAFVAFINM